MIRFQISILNQYLLFYRRIFNAPGVIPSSKTHGKFSNTSLRPLCPSRRFVLGFFLAEPRSNSRQSLPG